MYHEYEDHTEQMVVKTKDLARCAALAAEGYTVTEPDVWYKVRPQKRFEGVQASTMRPIRYIITNNSRFRHSEMEK